MTKKAFVFTVEKKDKINGRIIVDFEAKGLWHAGYIGGRDRDLAVSEKDRREEYQWERLPVTAKLTDEQARLCPTHIGCRRLSDYKRFIVGIDKLTPVAWNIGAMDHLVLEQRKKDILKAPVGQHYNKRDRDAQGDLIAGKGQSLVILLHGSPGVGKTLTAECVSEDVKKPLIALSIGDLVWEEKRLEQRLQEEFNRATDWDAILLLDEADVVLEARSFEDVRRNGIVSVFLRQLEYYQGVLFLTSNRVSTMDVAFQSRIQIGISFKTMTHDIRVKVWGKLLALNGRDKMIGTQTVREVKEKLGKFQLNGRKIRNVLNVADGLAFSEYGEPGRLKYTHIREAVESAVEFQNMLEESKASMKSDQTVWAMYRDGVDEF